MKWTPSLFACLFTLLCIGAYVSPAEARSEALLVNGRQAPGVSVAATASKPVAMACDCPRKRDRRRGNSQWNVSFATSQPAYAPVVYQPMCYQPVCYQPVYAGPVCYPAPVVYRARSARVIPSCVMAPCCQPSTSFGWSFSFGK